MARPARRALLVGKGDGVLVLIELDRLLDGVALIGIGAVAPRVEGPHVPLGLAMWLFTVLLPLMPALDGSAATPAPSAEEWRRA